MRHDPRDNDVARRAESSSLSNFRPPFLSAFRPAPSSESPFPNPPHPARIRIRGVHTRTENQLVCHPRVSRLRARDSRGEESSARSGFYFTRLPRDIGGRRRAILSYRRTCRRDDKRQIPTVGNELPKRRGGAVKEGHITQRATRGGVTWLFTRWRKKEGCVVCRLSSSYISLGIPAFRFSSLESTITHVNGASGKNSCRIKKRVCVHVCTRVHYRIHNDNWSLR